MVPFTVDPDKCKNDGLCAKACPARIIQMPTKKKPPAPVNDFEEHCLACGHCVTICPTGAFSLNWLSADECPAINMELTFSAEQAEQFLRTRRSIRNFKNKRVERNLLDKLLEIGCYAPSAKNNQPWHWTLVEDPAKVRLLAELVIDWMRSVKKKHPRIAKARGFERVVAAWDDGQERICRGAPHVIVVHTEKKYGFGAENCALALSYLELFAPVLGLGACWGGYFYSAANAYPPLFKALDLPRHHRAFGAMMVGYPKLKYQRMPLRYPPRVNWV
jgi:nitroreductase/NAD-dependent dihydropyrimidine dehydrogenase PreA subunit